MDSSPSEMGEPIIIVGGGLAGLTLGIGLRKRGIPVTIWEAGQYPRHRVCGEFISGRGLTTLAGLDLLQAIQKMGARIATRAAFIDGGRLVTARSLPHAALCIGRDHLDDGLAKEFQQLGGQLRFGERWQGQYGPGLARASGRQIERFWQRGRWIGLKAHTRGVTLAADLELHFVPSGYVGLCRLSDQRVNVCGLFHHPKPLPGLAQHWRDWMSGPCESLLHARLAKADWEVDSFCSIAGFIPYPRKHRPEEEFCLGDSQTMIPPLTGNGMSMAFESAELAMEPLTLFSQNRLNWPQTCQRFNQACSLRFSRRLKWAGWLQRTLLYPPTRSILFTMLSRSEWLWRMAFVLTR